MRVLQRGMYCPVPCFFYENEDIDYDTFTKHVVRVSKAGCLPLISGTLGEASLLAPEERMELIQRAREGLDEAGLANVAIVAGAGAPSTRESIELCIGAHKAGADAALIVPSGYYGGIYKANMSLLEQHFVDIAEASPIPVMMYDSIYVTGGIDMDSKLIENLARRSSNTCGVKLTCPSLGKMTRLTDVIHSKAFNQQYPRRHTEAPFLLLTGLIDNVLAATTVGADGCIGGPPNFAPYASARLWELSQGPLCGANLEEAVQLQAAIARADGVAFDAGVPALKWLLGDLYSAGKAPRKPLPCMPDEQGKKFKADLQEILEIEARLEKAARAL